MGLQAKRIVGVILQKVFYITILPFDSSAIMSSPLGFFFFPFPTNVRRWIPIPLRYLLPFGTLPPCLSKDRPAECILDKGIHSLSLRPESSCRNSKVCRETYPYDKRECTTRENMAARENDSCVYFIWCILFGRPHTSRYSNALEWTNSIRSQRGGLAAGRQAMSEPPNPFWKRHSFSSVIRMTSLLLRNAWMQLQFEIHWQYSCIHVIRRSGVVQGLWN